MAGYVYLIGNRHYKWYKIGKSISPEIRVKDIGILLPFHLDVIAIWKAKNHSLMEVVLHEKYVEDQINGEWFRFQDNHLAALIFKDIPDSTRIFPAQNNTGKKFLALSNNAAEGLTNGQKRQHGRLFSQAMKDYLVANELEETSENRKIARHIVKSQLSHL